MRPESIDLEGRVAVVTGAARGIGFAIARACAAAGMAVAISDLDAAEVRRAVDELGGSVYGEAFDVTDAGAFAGFLDQVERELGPPYALVNNAGVCFTGPFQDEDPRRTSLTLDVNVAAVVSGSELALAHFTRHGRGHLVNLASASSFIPMAGGVTYTASKHAVLGLTRALRAELHGTGIRVTAVVPGVIKTAMTSGFSTSGLTKVTDADSVAAAVVEALRHDRAEIFIPRETEVVARVLQVLPPRSADRVRRWLHLDRVMHAPQ